MARVVAIGTMIARVQQRADIQYATARFTTAILTDLVCEGLAELYEKIARVRGHDSFFRKSQTFTSVANQPNYDLTAIGAPDLYHLTSIDVAIGGTNWVLSCRPFMENERNRFRSVPIGWNYGQPIYYSIWGNSIEFIPQPSGGYTISLNYVPSAPIFDPTRQLDTFDGVNGWEEYGVLWAVKRVAMQDRDKDLYQMASQELAAMDARVTQFAAERDDQPERVHDVIGQDFWGAGWP
jgi:hypothetical protein